MATIIIRNSTGSGAVPSSLVQGELAINTVDGKLFYGSGSGNVVKEFTGSGGGGGSTFPYTGSAGISGSLDVNGPFTASSALISGNVTVLGTASISTLVVNQTQYSSGSNQLGDAANDTQTLYGSVIIPTGSLTVTGSTSIAGKIGLNDGGNSVYVGTNVGTIDDATNNRQVGIGYNVLSSSSIGEFNVGIGTDILTQLTSSVYNIGIGFRALTNTVADVNIGIGSYALNQNTTGNFNNAIGSNALISSSVGINNSAFGSSALGRSTSGSSNVALGGSSLLNIVTGSGNVAVGASAGRYFGTGTSANTDASSSIFLGRNTRANASGESNQIVIGFDALGLGSNTAVLGNDTITRTALKGNISVGTTGSISSTLHVKGSGATSATTALRVENTNASASLVVRDDGSNLFVGSNGTSAGTWIDATGSLSIIRSTFGTTYGLRVYNGAGWSGHDAILAIAYRYPIYGAQGSNGVAEASPLSAGAGVYGQGGVGVHGRGITPTGDTGSIGVMATSLYVHSGSNTALYNRSASVHILATDTSSNYSFLIQNSASQVLIGVQNNRTVNINSTNTADGDTQIGTTNGSLIINQGYNNRFSRNSINFYSGGDASTIQGFTTNPGIAVGYAQSNANPNTGSVFTVKGTAASSGSGVLFVTGSSTTRLLRIASEANADILTVSGSGTVGISNNGVANTALAITANGTGGGNFILQGYDSSAVNRFLVTATGRLQMTGATDTGTSGTDERVRLTNTFNPTSGTREHMGIYLVQAISQSGGANGITRGLYIQPTLTAATDYRAIESNNGRVVIADTATVTGSNATSLLDLSQTWNTSGQPIAIKLNITDTTSAALSDLVNLQVGGSTRFRIVKSGFFSFNTGGEIQGSLIVGSNATPTSRLQIRGSGTTSATTAFLVQNSTPTTLFQIQDNGLVGINRTPTASLDVAGTTRLSGSFNTSASGSILTVIGSGSTQPIFTVQGSQGELFSVTDSLSGSLFSVNDISGLPILEVFSDNTTLIGDYQDPMLITTKKVTMTNSGSFVVYSLPTASYDTAFFDYSIKSGSNARAGQIMAIQSGSSVNFTETTTTDFGSTTAVSFTVLVSGSNMVLTGSAATGSWTIKTIVRGI